MGDTGPCGPCSEIFYDHGSNIVGGPPGSKDEDGDRYIEIWNLVFMQFDRDENGSMTALPKPSVDTGMGLERLAAVMQSVHSNYETDLFKNLISATKKILAIEVQGSSSLNVIVDHIRACAFLIIDGVNPGNEGRNYVLRRILRRAIRHGKKLGVQEAFFYKLVAPLAKEMGEAYPELVSFKSKIEDVIKAEEKRFSVTLDQGMEILEEAIKNLNDLILPGEIAFKLYDTYGFPVDLTNDIARERNISIDMDGFEKAMQTQRSRAREANKFTQTKELNLEANTYSDFLGYEFTDNDSNVTELFSQGVAVNSIQVGDEGMLVTNATAFYAESGGQVGDTGVIETKDSVFKVTDTQKCGEAIMHYGVVDVGEITVGNQVKMRIDKHQRLCIAANHSATHLMHAALRSILGDNVMQKGSLVDANRLRFDFSHNKPLSKEELTKIESEVNYHIQCNHRGSTVLMTYDDAIKSGAMALFGEKYADKVRVLNFGDYSIELCGGTHVLRTGDIGLFKIISESGVASGIRRIEAVTGMLAIKKLTSYKDIIDNASSLLKTSSDQVLTKIEQLLKQNRVLERELAATKQQILGGDSSDLTERVIQIGKINILIHRLDGLDAKSLRTAIDKFKSKLGSAIVILGSIHEDKVKLAVGVTKDLNNQISAGNLIKSIAEIVGGKGGGRPDFAQAGGPDKEKVDEALKLALKLIKDEL